MSGTNKLVESKNAEKKESIEKLDKDLLNANEVAKEDEKKK